MSLSDDQIQSIIERAQTAMQTPRVEKDACAGLPNLAEATLVFVPGFVPAPERAIRAIQTKFGDGIQLVFLDDVVCAVEGIPCCRLDWATQKNELVALLVRAQSVVLLAPDTALLARMGDGDPEDFSEALMRRILWGKRVEILLDFDPPKFRRGTFFAKLSEAIDSLSAMGFGFFTYQPAESCPDGVCALVTERDVVAAKQGGRKTILCAAGAIVTPLAVDTAKELQIHIERAQA